MKLAQWMVLENRMILKKIFNVYLLFSYNLPLENGLILHLIKIKYFLHMDALCQVCLKLAQWLWKCSVFFHYQVFCYQFLLKNKHGPSFEKFKSPLAQGSFVTSLKEDKNVKSSRQQLWTTEKAHLHFWLRWAKN